MATLYVRQAGNWSDANTWSATGWGGAAASARPAATDDCIFGADATGIVTVDSATLCLCKSVAFNSANNRLVFGAGFILQCSWAYNSGAFDMAGIVSGTGTLQLRAAATSYIGAHPGALQFSVAGTYVMGDNWTITGLVTVTTATVLNNNGTAKTLTANGGLTMTSTLQGTALVVLGGGTWSGTAALYNDTTIQGTGVISGGVAYRGGTLTSVVGCSWTTTGSTLTIAASCTLNIPHITLADIFLSGSQILNLTGNLIVSGYVLIYGASVAFTGAGQITASRWRQMATSAANIVTLPDGGVLTVTDYLDMIASYPISTTLKSTTAGQPAYLNFTGLPANCNIARAVFTDINASGSAQRLDDWNAGALTNVVNIRALDSTIVAATEAALVAALAALTPPTTPVLSTYLRDGDAGSVVTTGDADSTIEVWGATLFDADTTLLWQKIGELVGPGTVTLDFSDYSLTSGELAGWDLTLLVPAKIVAVAVSPSGVRSAWSNVLGSLIGADPGITATLDQIVAATGSMFFTVAGLASETDTIMWSYTDENGNIILRMFTGNGQHEWDGSFAVGREYDFIGFPQNRQGQFVLLPIGIHIDEETVVAPTLTAVVNDGTGTTATLTLTPPATGPYDSTNIYSRQQGYPDWTLSGTYVGAAGVAGTAQATGLTANRTYEFMVLAVASGLYSQPSTILAMRIAASTVSQKSSIKDDVVAALRTITIANGYNQDVATDLVFAHRPFAMTDTSTYPALFCWEEVEAASNRLIQSHTVKSMNIVVGVWVGQVDDPEDALDKICCDIEKALMVSRTRGGYAVDTALVNVDPEWRPAGTEPTGIAYLTFAIQYRHTVGNPF
jgi:hypothetical protein